MIALAMVDSLEPPADPADVAEVVFVEIAAL